MFEEEKDLETQEEQSVQSAEQSEQEGNQVEESQQEEEQQAPQQVQENSKDYNFRALREAKEAREKENEELKKKLNELYEYVKQGQQNNEKKEEPEEEEDFSINPDDLVEGKHLSKFQKRQQREFERIKKKLDQYEQQQKYQQVRSKLVRDLPDIEKVVTSENLEKLEREYPELAASVRDTKDLETRGKAAHRLIKQLGIYKDPTYGADVDRAKANAKKPKPSNMASPQAGDTPLSKANEYARPKRGLSEADAERIRREMEEAIRNG